MHWTWDETAWCYRARAALTCHRHGSIDRAARPWYRTNLALRTAQTNLTSAAPTASSAAQMFGENEDSYVQFCIQTQSTGIACETYCWRYSCSSVEKLKDSVTAEGGNYSNAGLSIKPRAPALRNMMSHCIESKRQNKWDWLGLKGIKKWGVGGFLSL